MCNPGLTEKVSENHKNEPTLVVPTNRYYNPK